MNQEYKTIRELGRGAAGVVSLVRRRRDGRMFAAKEVSFSDAAANTRRAGGGGGASTDAASLRATRLTASA